MFLSMTYRAVMRTDATKCAAVLTYDVMSMGNTRDEYRNMT